MTKITRRNFLKMGAAVATAGMGAGCAPRISNKENQPSVDEPSDIDMLSALYVKSLSHDAGFQGTLNALCIKYDKKQTPSDEEYQSVWKALKKANESWDTQANKLFLMLRGRPIKQQP